MEVPIRKGDIYLGGTNKYVLNGNNSHPWPLNSPGSTQATLEGRGITFTASCHQQWHSDVPLGGILCWGDEGEGGVERRRLRSSLGSPTRSQGGGGE